MITYMGDRKSFDWHNDVRTKSKILARTRITFGSLIIAEYKNRKNSILKTLFHRIGHCFFLLNRCAISHALLEMKLFIRYHKKIAPLLNVCRIWRWFLLNSFNLPLDDYLSVVSNGKLNIMFMELRSCRGTYNWISFVDIQSSIEKWMVWIYHKSRWKENCNM